MDSARRIRWSVGAALLAHAGAFWWTIDRRAARTEVAESIRAPEIEVEVEVSAPESPASVVGAAFLPSRRESGTRVEGRPSSSRASEIPSARAAPAADDSWTLSPSPSAPRDVHLSSAALGDAVRAGVSATVAETRPPNDPSKRIFGSFSQHDIELGLVPGAEFVSLTRDTVRTSGAPTTGHATLEFEVDAAGILVFVHVLDASSDWAQWNEVAAEIAKAARAHVLGVPSASRGFALKMEVTSAIRTASGQDPTRSALTKALGAMSDPLDALVDGAEPARRVVAARIVAMSVL